MKEKEIGRAWEKETNGRDLKWKAGEMKNNETEGKVKAGQTGGEEKARRV